jgi:transcriptional regulator with PAS, ATPase and Fis domain
MTNTLFWDEYPSAVTICDKDAVIVYMNQKAQNTFLKWGGNELIGKSLFDCHGEKSKQKIRELLQSGQANTYTIEKNGLNKLIHQSAWYVNGKIAGLIELSIELPEKMDHFKR